MTERETDSDRERQTQRETVTERQRNRRRDSDRERERECDTDRQDRQTDREDYILYTPDLLWMRLSMVVSHSGHSLVLRQQLRHRVLWPHGISVMSDIRMHPGAPHGSDIPGSRAASPPMGSVRRARGEEAPAFLITPGLWGHRDRVYVRWRVCLPEWGTETERGDPVWPSGKGQVCKRKDLGSIPPRLSFLFKKGCGLWTLSCDFVHHFLLKH